MTAAGRTDDCVSTGVLTDRGWTPAAVRRLLGDPDRTVPDPVYRSAAPMRLFSPARVAAAQNTEQWRQRRERAEQRSARSKAVADAKRVYAAIADSYPDLADQARRQAAERREL
jgi:hypothetical protein